MKTILMLLALFLFVSCTNKSDPIKVITADLITTSLSNVIISSLDCTAIDIVKADTAIEVNKWFALQTNQKSIIGDLCKTTIADIVPLLIGSIIPMTWQCKQTKVDNLATTLSDLACANI